MRELAAMLQNVLREFDAVLRNETGATLVETTTIPGKPGAPVELVTRAEFTLAASKALQINLAHVEKAVNAEEVLRFIVDQHYRPFQEQIAKAAYAASVQWRLANDVHT